MSPSDHKLNTTLALALALGAIAPATASARQELNPPPTTTTPSQPAVQIVRVPAPRGFDWSDAGIGAAGALGLSTLALGSGLVITARRHQTPGTPDPTRRRTPHQRDAGHATPGADSKSKSVSDQQEAVK